MDYLKIINSFYGEEDSLLKRILLIHSQSVARKALQIVSSHPEIDVDRQFIEEAAMLHDIGIIKCDAPGIACHGTEPYICHGRLGAEMLRELGYPRHARVCERHTGAGLSKKDIIYRNLPLPHENFFPETLEEKLICYADKFYSKTHLDKEKDLKHIESSISKFGEESLLRFRQLEGLFKL